MQINYCIYSIQRSGRHIVEKFLRQLNYNFCNCGSIDDETITKECYNTHIHLKHEGGNNFNFNRIKKCIFLYRKDIVEQIDANIRLLYTQTVTKKYLQTTQEHLSCTIDPNLSYEEIISVIKTSGVQFNIHTAVHGVRKFYKQMEENQNSNTLFVDFDSLIYDSNVQLKKIAKFISSDTINDITIDSAIDKFMLTFGEYVKKNMSVKNYNKLKKLIDTCSVEDTVKK
jgi:hypothetical protein